MLRCTLHETKNLKFQICFKVCTPWGWPGDVQKVAILSFLTTTILSFFVFLLNCTAVNSRPSFSRLSLPLPPPPLHLPPQPCVSSCDLFEPWDLINFCPFNHIRSPPPLLLSSLLLLLIHNQLTFSLNFLVSNQEIEKKASSLTFRFLQSLFPASISVLFSPSFSPPRLTIFLLQMDVRHRPLLLRRSWPTGGKSIKTKSHWCKFHKNHIATNVRKITFMLDKFTFPPLLTRDQDDLVWSDLA